MKSSNNYMQKIIVTFMVLFVFGCGGSGGGGETVNTDTNIEVIDDIIPVEESLTSIADINVNEEFDFSTTKKISLLVKTPVTGVIVRVLDKMPAGFNDSGEIVGESGETELLKFVTDNTGEFEINGFSIPNYLNTIVLATRYIGIPDYITVSITGDEIIVDYTDPSTFSTLTAKAMIKEYLEKIYGFVKNINFLELILPASAYAQEPFNDYNYLGTGEGDWDSSGVPYYLEADRDVISSELLTEINLSLPERSKVPEHHPEYLYDAVGGDLQTSVHLTEEAEVFVTFVHEGAGYRNVLGYFYYGVNGIEQPSVVEDIENRTIIFPNVSYAGSGGGLISGDKVKLVGPNPDGTFPAGTTVGWFILANGYISNSRSVTRGNGTVYSNKGIISQYTIHYTSHYTRGGEPMSRGPFTA